MTAHDKAWELLKMNISSDLMEKRSAPPDWVMNPQAKHQRRLDDASNRRRTSGDNVFNKPSLTANRPDQPGGITARFPRGTFSDGTYDKKLTTAEKIIPPDDSLDGGSQYENSFSSNANAGAGVFSPQPAWMGQDLTQHNALLAQGQQQYGQQQQLGQGQQQRPPIGQGQQAQSFQGVLGNRGLPQQQQGQQQQYGQLQLPAPVATGEPMDLAFRLLKSLNPEVEDTPEEDDEEDDGMTDEEMDEWMKELAAERREWEISQRSDDPTSPHFYEEGYDEHGHPTDPTDPSNQDDDPEDFLDNYGLRNPNYVGKMSDMPSMPSMPSMSSPPSGSFNGKNKNGHEEYSHKDLDAESLIDFLVQTLQMDYQDAKTLATHHKTKELASASQRKARAAANEMTDEGPSMSEMG